MLPSLHLMSISAEKRKAAEQGGEGRGATPSTKARKLGNTTHRELPDDFLDDVDRADHEDREESSEQELSDTESEQDIVTHVFKYADGCVIKYRTEVSKHSIDLEMVGEGTFDISIERPFTSEGASNATSSRIWRKRPGCRRTVSRAIHAVYDIMTRLFPKLTSITYEDRAVVDGWDLSVYKRYREKEGLSRRDAIERTIADMYWRVKYYESIGFEFERNYRDVVNEAVDYLYEQRGRLDAAAKREVDFSAEPFSGDLMEIARVMPNEAISVNVLSSADW